MYEVHVYMYVYIVYTLCIESCYDILLHTTVYCCILLWMTVPSLILVSLRSTVFLDSKTLPHSITWPTQQLQAVYSLIMPID
jgi:hypothetical protein